MEALSHLQSSLIDPLARSLFLACLGIALFRVVRSEMCFDEVLPSLLISLCGFVFWEPAVSSLRLLSNNLTAEIVRLTQAARYEQVFATALESIDKAPSSFPTNTGHLVADSSALVGNAMESVRAVLRGGVWSVARGIVEFLFVVSSEVIEHSSRILFYLVSVFLPLTAAVYAFVDRPFKGLVRYIVELALWQPTLVLVHALTGAAAAAEFKNVPGSDASNRSIISILVIEIVSVCLTFSIPSLIHKIISGAVEGDLGADLHGRVKRLVRI